MTCEGTGVIDPSCFRLPNFDARFPLQNFSEWERLLPILNTFAPVPPPRLAILSALAKLAVDDPETFDVVIGDHVEHLGLAK